jgi:hypothetical protein
MKHGLRRRHGFGRMEDFSFSNGSTLRRDTGKTLMKKLILHIIEHEKYVPHNLIIFFDNLPKYIYSILDKNVDRRGLDVRRVWL